MKNSATGAAFAVLVIFLIAATSGCTASGKEWSITLQGDPAMAINQSVYASLENCNQTVDEVTGVPLEIFFYYYGLYPVTAMTIDGHQYDWKEECYRYKYDIPFLVLPDGRIYDGNETYAAGNITVTTSPMPAHSTLELAPSIMYSLAGEGSEGLINGSASQIIVYYVDALGYERYEKAKANGTINNITALGTPIEATCVYPSVSRVNSRALVTGKPPNLIKGDLDSGIPDSETVLDRLQAQGKSAVWIAGVSSPVFMGDDIVYRPDTNGNWQETDEIATEAIRQYLNGTNLIFVHFKDTDKKAHSFGPESAQAVAAMIDADQKIGQINSVLEPGTVVVIFSDHGMHDIISGGNHGTLLPEDMIVPIVVYRV